MNGFGDNPYDDGLDFVGCPPRETKLRLPQFPENLKGDCKFLRWGRCNSVPDGERILTVEIDDFEPDPNECSVYNGEVHFRDMLTGQEWYKGELKFYYTRNYVYPDTSMYGEKKKSIAFRFVVKGDLERVSDNIPEQYFLILCTKTIDEPNINAYKQIFVYGGFDILFDFGATSNKPDFLLSLGHNDGWYTHLPKCSNRPIDWTGYGDYIGHYCDRGWLFVSPGRNFVFDPGIKPPTGRFLEEALRQVGKKCHTEDAIRYGGLDLQYIRCIHSYQYLQGITECKTSFNSTEFCQGVIETREKHPWLTFFSMGYWMDRFQIKKHILHLAEGNIQVHKPEYEEYKNGLYFYGFATQHQYEDLKLVDLASNKDIIGAPASTQLLLYLYNAGVMVRNPRLRLPLPIDPKLSLKLMRDEILSIKKKDICQFLKEEKKENITEQRA